MTGFAVALLVVVAVVGLLRWRRPAWYWLIFGVTLALHSVSVAGAVVRDDGRLLAIRRADNGTWELPGGVLELTEAPEDGVAREVWAETGIRVEVDELTGVYKNTTRGIVALVFRCKPSGGGERTLRRVDRS
jgi:ADP-ribose pyrophosphatase YjhB (NUDIX family)